MARVMPPLSPSRRKVQRSIRLFFAEARAVCATASKPGMNGGRDAGAAAASTSAIRPAPSGLTK
jgi:hypothetical protein